MFKILIFILIIGLIFENNAFSINQFFKELIQDEMIQKIQGMTHEEICGRQPWKIIQDHSKAHRVKRLGK